MNKQLIQDIKVGNKSIDTAPVKYTVETKDECYYSYNGLYYDYNYVSGADDYDNDITLSYIDIVDIKVSDV